MKEASRKATFDNLRNQALQRFHRANAEVIKRAVDEGNLNREWGELIKALKIQRGAIDHLIQVNGLIFDYERYEEDCNERAKGQSSGSGGAANG